MQALEDHEYLVGELRLDADAIGAHNVGDKHLEGAAREVVILFEMPGLFP